MAQWRTPVALTYEMPSALLIWSIRPTLPGLPWLRNFVAVWNLGLSRLISFEAIWIHMTHIFRSRLVPLNCLWQMQTRWRFTESFDSVKFSDSLGPWEWGTGRQFGAPGCQVQKAVKAKLVQKVPQTAGGSDTAMLFYAFFISFNSDFQNLCYDIDPTKTTCTGRPEEKCWMLLEDLDRISVALRRVLQSLCEHFWVSLDTLSPFLSISHGLCMKTVRPMFLPTTWVFPKIVVPQNGWFIRENPINMDYLGVPLFLEKPTFLRRSLLWSTLYCWRSTLTFHPHPFRWRCHLQKVPGLKAEFQPCSWSMSTNMTESSS